MSKLYIDREVVEQAADSLDQAIRELGNAIRSMKCDGCGNGPDCSKVLQAQLDATCSSADMRAALSAAAPAVPDAAKPEIEFYQTTASNGLPDVAYQIKEPETQGDWPTLLPCPFCGNENPEFERHGTLRQSCIVVCGNCGCQHESSDEGPRCGTSWNTRAALLAAGPAIPAPHECKTEDEKLAYAFGWWKALEHARATGPAHVEPLTEAALNSLREKHGITSTGRGIREWSQIVRFAREIEAYHGIGKDQAS